MAKYKNQHLVPQVYLKNFIKESENGNEKHEPGIFVTNKQFESWKEKSTSHKTFVRSYFYTLENEDKENPIVEKYLSSIERQYTTTLENILSKKISIDDIHFISYFTFIQLMRVEKHIEPFQESMNRLAEMVSDIHGVDIQEETKDLAKRMLLNFGNDIETNVVFQQGVHFIENHTDEDFIISDSPVVHRMFHIDELQNILNTTPLQYNNYLPKDELVLFFFPLTPKIALIATKFIALKDNGIQYISVTDKTSILKLNLLSYENAHNNIYSPTPNPFNKDLEEAIIQHTHRNKNIPYHLCKIYTSTNRYVFKLRKYKYIKRENRVIDDLKLYFVDKNDIKNMINDGELESITIYDRDGGSQHMKKIELGKYDEKLNTLEINSKLKF